LLAALSGCALLQGYGIYPYARPVSFVDDADPGSLLAAIDRTNVAHDRLAGLLRATRGDPARREVDLRRAFRIRQPFRHVLLTGYYAPEIDASPVPTPDHQHPVYARPPELQDGVPYLTRAEIESGALVGRGLEIAWARDPIDVFYLQIQGSGRARFPGSTTLGLLFAGTNSRPYTSLGRTMIDRNLITFAEASPDGIRRALARLPPAEATALLHTNERYVFFRPDDGPVVGSLGVPLTHGRSIALDPEHVAPGSVLYLETPSFRRFVVAQDTGAAIKGARADLFIGAGAEAGKVAGRLRERGRLWVLTAK
jgi:membrane-bound lytic murein transglycosylase A